MRGILAAHNHNKSRPAWARGLKQIGAKQKIVEAMSRPAWARGLKRRGLIFLEPIFSRAPRGRVD